jgi:hypothetical protein
VGKHMGVGGRDRGEVHAVGNVRGKRQSCHAWLYTRLSPPIRMPRADRPPSTPCQTHLKRAATSTWHMENSAPA